MKLTHTIRLAMAGLALAAGTAVVAHAGAGEDCRHGKHGGYGHRSERMEKRVDQLGLDDATRQKVDAILADARERRSATWEQMRDARAKMHDMLSRPDV